MPLKPSLRPVFPCLILAAAVLAGCSTTATGPARASSAAAASKRGQLRLALAHADRMTVVAAAPEGSVPMVRELRGSAIVVDFLDNLEIDEGFGPVHCDCPDDAVFAFYAGDKPLATLSLHRLDYVRWQDGPWTGDAVLTVAASQWLQQWGKEAGCDVTTLMQSMVARDTDKNNASRRRFLAEFNPEARKIFEGADDVIYNGHHLRRIATPLAERYADKAALAAAGLRALGESPQRWLEDDWSVGAVQTALMALDPTVVRAAMERLQNDDNALLGVARFFFRTGFYEKLPAADRDAWAIRLADLELRVGRDADKHALLEYVALVPGTATAGFLQAIAQGSRTYTYAPPCEELTLDIEEPGLRYAAAVLLAKRGDPSARGLVDALSRLRPFGPDQAAVEIAAALLDGNAPLRPAHFKYRSRTLGLAALAALEWRPGSAISLDVLAAACGNFQDDVATRAEQIARHYQLQRADDEADENEPVIDYDPLLASSYPELAVEEYSALIPKVSGLNQARLLTLRAQAYASLGDYAAAEADYQNVVKTSFVDGTDVRTRLAWVQWYRGEFGPAEQTIAAGLDAEPSAELVLLRGIMHYSMEDFSRRTEADLIAARVLDPKEGYAALLQHLVAGLGGHPEQSQLTSYLSTSPDVPDWPRQIMGFMLGYIDAPRLLEIARASDPKEVAWHTCEATFYASQVARVAGRTDEEMKYLDQCVATDQPDVAEFWVAKFRLARLRPAKNSAPEKQRTGSAPTI